MNQNEENAFRVTMAIFLLTTVTVNDVNDVNHLLLLADCMHYYAKFWLAAKFFAINVIRNQTSAEIIFCRAR